MNVLTGIGMVAFGLLAILGILVGLSGGAGGWVVGAVSGLIWWRLSAAYEPSSFNARAEKHQRYDLIRPQRRRNT